MRKKGFKHTEETRRKMSESHKGEKNHFYGKHLTEEHKRKLSESQRGEKNHNYGRPLSDEHKSKISEAQKGNTYAKGYEHTGEAKRKISEGNRGNTKCKGRKLSEETKRKISVGRKGEKNPRWKGGWENYYGPSWKSQRRKALKRDGHICRKCKKFESNGNEISVHHIIRFADFGVERHEEANDLSNLITLCQKCHRKIEDGPNGIEICRGLIGYVEEELEVYEISGLEEVF